MAIVVNAVVLMAEHPVLVDELQYSLTGAACIGESHPKAATVEGAVEARRSAARKDVLKLALAIAVGVTPASVFGRVSVLIHRPFKLEEFCHHCVLFFGIYPIRTYYAKIATMQWYHIDF